MTRESYHCPQCGRLIYYKGLCWECTAEQKIDKALALTRKEVEEKQPYIIEKIFHHCLTVIYLSWCNIRKAAVCGGSG